MFSAAQAEWHDPRAGEGSEAGTAAGTAKESRGWKEGAGEKLS